MAHAKTWLLRGALTLLLAAPAWAQDDTTPQPEDAAAGETDAALLTPDELQTLVAPVALYPDTLLIQILVASTFPLEIVKAQEFLEDNAGTAPADLEEEIDAKGWDDSVAVLATAFPDVLTDMASHVDWTDSMGTAMLAQSDDVMDAVQVKREQAQEAGTLTSNDQQTVEVTQEGDAGDTIIIEPTDPQVVYVPQYDPQVIYDPGPDVGDAVAAGLIGFATFALIDDIFDDDDPWNGYWGCGNCGGWNGRPIINNPDIDIDVDGDVNIGNRPDIGWNPDSDRVDQAKDRIADHRGNGATTLPMAKPDRADQLRQNLAQRTGAQDISRDRDAAGRLADQLPAGGIGAAAGAAAGAAGALADRPRVNRPDGGLSQGDRAEIADRTKSLPQVTRPAGGGQVKRPEALPKRPAAAKAPVRKAAPNRGAALHHSGSPARAKAGAARGRAAAGGRPNLRR